jgi:hypothetical protein
LLAVSEVMAMLPFSFRTHKKTSHTDSRPFTLGGHTCYISDSDQKV